MNNIVIELKTEWDGQLLQTAYLQPKQGSAVLIDFPLEPDAVDAGLPKPVAKVLASGLAEYGVVAGRWFRGEAAVPAEAAVFPAPVRNVFHRIADRASRTWVTPVVVTRSPEVISALLDQGWSVQDQALLLFDADDRTSPEQAVEALSKTRTWTDFTFPRPARVLIAPGVDGDYILIAGATQQDLDILLGCLASAFSTAGFSLPVRG